jgi:Domain of unknown function (DUF4397)
MRIMKAVGLSVLGLSITVAGCSKESNQTQAAQTESGAGASKAPESSAAAKERGEALVRVVNAVPDAPPIDVIAEEDKAFTGVEAKAVTPYKPIPASANDFKIAPAAQESAQPLAENSEAIMSGRHYTLVAFPESAAARADKADTNDRSDTNEKVSLDVIADDLVPPPAGKARIRVINAAPGMDDVSVYLKGQDDELFSDVDFKEAVSYKQVDPMNTTVVLRTSPSALTDVNPKTGERSDATTPATPAARADRPATDREADRRDANPNASRMAGDILGNHTVNIEAGKSYTIVLVGGKSGRQIETLVVEDMIPETSAPTE